MESFEEAKDLFQSIQPRYAELGGQVFTGYQKVNRPNNKRRMKSLSMTNRQKLHLICNAHIDPVWLWEWQEGAAEAISTFRVAAELCEQFDGFVFNHNEVILYQWVEEFEPALFKRIQKLVKA